MLAQPYDGLVLANPQVQILDEISEKVQSLGIHHLNVSKELSSALMTVPTTERSRFAQERMKDLLGQIKDEPILCSHPSSCSNKKGDYSLAR